MPARCRALCSSLPFFRAQGRDWVITTADGGQCVEPDGLHFLLKTCELLDPEMMGCSRWAVACRVANQVLMTLSIRIVLGIRLG